MKTPRIYWRPKSLVVVLPMESVEAATNGEARIVISPEAGLMLTALLFKEFTGIIAARAALESGVEDEA